MILILFVYLHAYFLKNISTCSAHVLSTIYLKCTWQDLNFIQQYVVKPVHTLKNYHAHEVLEK